jgi:hypothetical protein
MVTPFTIVAVAFSSTAPEQTETLDEATEFASSELFLLVLTPE